MVDRKVGKNHLFKNSIILIKAWCYYESRLLGAHHGLISTYALEILILYIFNLFHKSLHGPLEVLYRFLEYFSKFDWDNYCLSLNGPVALSSLPNLTVEATGTRTDDLLFDKDFLKCSVDEVLVPPRGSGQSGACYTRFRPKHLNIIDPLKEYNNLGRSVNRASFHRIRIALTYGARKLGQILMLQSEVLPNEFYGFFKNTLARNGRGFRPDVGSTGACHRSFGNGKHSLGQISSMSISYRNRDENNAHRDLSKSLSGSGSYVTNGPTHFSSCFPGEPNIAPSTDQRSSHIAVHHEPKQYSFYQESSNGGSENRGMDYYVDHETEQLSYCAAKTCVDDRSLIHSRLAVNNQLPTLNSYANVNNLVTDEKSWNSIQVKKQQLPPLSLRLPDLSGDLDLQFRCLRHIQYHLEYLFDAFLKSVQEASSDYKFQKPPFHIPTLNILLDADAALPELLVSSAECNEMKLSPVSCSHSTEGVSQHSQDEDSWDVVCQQNISLLSGADIPSSGLSPSSSYVDSDSSVSWCYSSEDSPLMHGTDTCSPRKSYDTYKEQLAPSREDGKILTTHAVQIGSNKSSAPGGSFIPHEEQVALPGRIKEVMIGQPVKVLGYIHSDKKAIEKLSCDPQKEFVRHDAKTRQITKYHGSVCLNMNTLQNQQDDTDREFAQTPSTLRQVPKYEPFNSVVATAKDCTSASRNLPRKQNCGTGIDDGILAWQARRLPSYEPSKLQNRHRGRFCPKNRSATKQSSNNQKAHLSFVTGREHVQCNSAVSILNGREREVNSEKFDENGYELWPLLPKVPPFHSINIQERPPLSDTSITSFPIIDGQPLETIEFGSLGPFALALSKSKKVTNTHSGRKVLTDAASVVQRSSIGPRHSRSPEFCRGSEDEFPPLNAVVR